MKNTNVYVLNQIKTPKIFPIITQEDSCRAIQIKPSNEIILIENIGDKNQSISFCEESTLPDDVLKHAFVLHSKGFTEQCAPTHKILSRTLDVTPSSIVFNCFENSLAVSAFTLSLDENPKYVIRYDVAERKFDFDFEDNYSSVFDFFEQYNGEYLKAFISDKAFTSLYDEDAAKLSVLQDFLDATGFSVVMQERKNSFKTRTLGSRYLWDILLRYLFLLEIEPNLADIMNSDAKRDIYKLLFVDSSVAFARHLRLNATNLKKMA